MKMRYILCGLILFSSHQVKPLSIGSLIAVSVQAFVSFPQVVLIGINEILAFASMQNGFSLQNSSTNLTFGSVFPVSGTVDLNGGTMTLNTDFIFRNPTTLNGLGVIVGNGHVMRFCSDVTTLPADTVSFSDTVIFHDANLSIPVSISFLGNCTINGNGNVLSLGTSGELVVASGGTLTLRNMDIVGISGTKIRCASSTACLIFDNVRWFQEDYYECLTGSMKIQNNVEFSGTSTFYYAASGNFFIDTDTDCKFNEGITFKIGRKLSTFDTQLTFSDSSSTLILSNADFVTTESGVLFTKGQLVLDRIVSFDTIFTDTQRGIIFGDGTSANDVTVQFNPGCVVNHNSGYWVYRNANQNLFESNALASEIVRNEGSLFKIERDLTLNKLTFSVASDSVAPPTIANGVRITYDDTHIRLPSVEFDIIGYQTNQLSYVLGGNGDLFFSRGSLSVPVTITSVSNTIHGTGNIEAPISLSSGSQLNLGFNGLLNETLSLNQGQVIFQNNVECGIDGLIEGPGIVDLESYKVLLSSIIQNYDTPIMWDGSNATIELSRGISLSETWTLSGNITIEGNQNNFTLSDLGSLRVQPHTNLTLKNITLVGVNNNALQLTSDSSLLTLSDAHLIFDQNYTLTKGQIVFERESSFSGPYTISFEQSQTNTIAQNSQISILNGATYKIGRMGSVEPLYFQDDSAQLMFNNSNFSIASGGARMSRGTVIFEKECAISFNSTNTGNGLQLGDGTAVGDVVFQFNPGAKIALNAGHILQNIYDINKGFLGLSTSVELSLNPGLIVHYLHNGSLEDMTLVINPPTQTTFDPSANVYFANIQAKTSFGTALITARRLTTSVLALDGTGNSIEITNGSYVLPITIFNSGSVLKGTGTMSGLITLYNSSASLNIGLQGILQSTIVMNNGTILLTNGLQLGNGTTLMGPGIINLGSYFLKCGAGANMWQSPLQWISNGGGIDLQSNTSLSSTWTIQGSLDLKGHNYSLNMQNGGTIYISDNSTLLLENIKLKGLSNQSIQFGGTGSKFVLNNVICEFDDSFNMRQGAIEIDGATILRGKNKVFAYESSRTSTIKSESRLTVDQGLTFSYYPSSWNQNLFEFEDDSGVFELKNSFIYTGTQGLHLRSGQLLIGGNSECFVETIDSEYGVVSNVGLTLGDDDEQYDCTFHIGSGSTFAINHGALNYRNVSENALIFENVNSNLYIAQDSVLRIYQDMILNSGRCTLQRGGQIQRFNDKRLIGALYVE